MAADRTRTTESPAPCPFHACRQHMALRDGRPDALKRVTVLPAGRPGRGPMATSSRSVSAKTTGPGKVTGLVDGCAAQVANPPAEPTLASNVGAVYDSA